ncbi:hypothetical protein M3Y97_01070400 [Aphelenchoides bicaudatus]|nr:hypothetical protein M3Y97_01070400 [Aphelenchoides bicaudatus]
MPTTWTLTILFCLFTVTHADKTYPSKNQDVSVKRVTNLVSSFPSSDQYKAIFNNISGNIYNQAEWDTIKNDAMNKIMDILTTTQYATLLTKISALSSQMTKDEMMNALNKAVEVLSNNLWPFFSQLQGYVKYLKERGLKEAAVVKNGYRITNSFCSKKRIKEIFTRVSLRYSADDWNAIVSSLDGVLQFSKNGFKASG